MWIAKDKNGSIHLFDREPEKVNADIGGGKTIPIWDDDDGERMEIIDDYDEFKDLVSWEDDEPLEVKLFPINYKTI